MTTLPRWARIVGFVIHLLIGVLMILSGSMKVSGRLPAEDAAKLGEIGNHLLLIGIGEVVTAILMIIPRTSALGVLLASAFWGGAICFHMARLDPETGKQEPYIAQSVLLVLTWVGGYLRNPGMLGRLFG